MKKTYSAPMIEFDDFTLCTSIAVGCEVISNQAMYVCQYVVGRGSNKKNVFTEDYGCDYSEGVIEEADGSPSYNGVCYHVPIEANNLFTS